MPVMALALTCCVYLERLGGGIETSSEVLEASLTEALESLQDYSQTPFERCLSSVCPSFCAWSSVGHFVLSGC